jgi:hypothetical protein
VAGKITPIEGTDGAYMNKARNLIQGASGGLLTGAFLGLAEATGHLIVGGAPDLYAPFVGVLTYAVAGFPLGILMGVITTLREKDASITDGVAWAMGAIGPITILGTGLVYRALLEQSDASGGLDEFSRYGLVAAMFLLVLGVRRYLPMFLDGAFRVLLTGFGLLGTFGMLLLVTGALSFVRVGDVAGAWPTSETAWEQLDRPNLLTIVVDGLRSDVVVKAQMPHLTALSDDALSFNNNITQSTDPATALATIVTGLMPRQHGVQAISDNLAMRHTTLAELLSTSGYVTGILLNDQRFGEGFTQGNAVEERLVPSRWLDAPKSVTWLTLYKFGEAVASLKSGINLNDDLGFSSSSLVAAKGAQFIQAYKENTWALTLHLRGVAGKNGSASALTAVDAAIGGLVGEVRRSGLYDNTVIVVVSTRGTADNGSPQLSPETVRAPVVIKLNNGALTGHAVPWQSRSIDIAPTLANILRIPADTRMAGQELTSTIYNAHLWLQAAAVAAQRYDAAIVTRDAVIAKRAKIVANWPKRGVGMTESDLPVIPTLPPKPVQASDNVSDGLSLDRAAITQGTDEISFADEGFLFVVTGEDRALFEMASGSGQNLLEQGTSQEHRDIASRHEQHLKVLTR